MFGSPIIEVIIGLLFVYSLLAILVTQINAVIANLLNLRARHLKGAMQALITDPQIQAHFLSHPLIGLIRERINPQDVSTQAAAQIADSPATDVAWIQPGIFADVMVDLVSAQAGTERDLYGPLLRVANTVLEPVQRAYVQALVRKMQMEGAGLDDLLTYVMSLGDPADRQAMTQALSELESAIHAHGSTSGDFIGLIRGLRKIENPQFQQALDTLLESARSVEEAKTRLANWFDKSMEHVTDTYRRRIQIISIAVGLLIAMTLNVDSLQIARTLWDDPALREAVYLAANNARDSGQLEQMQDITTPGLETTQPGPSNPQETLLNLGESASDTAFTVENLLDLRLPIGWYHAAAAEATAQTLGLDPQTDPRNLWNYAPGNNPDHWLSLVALKLLGIALTTIAVSQGAPFWFDLMNRIARGGSSN